MQRTEFGINWNFGSKMVGFISLKASMGQYENCMCSIYKWLSNCGAHVVERLEYNLFLSKK